MLFNSLFQALRRAANVPTVAVAHKLINYVAVMMGRQHVFLGSWKELSSCKNNTGFDGEKAAFHSRRNLLFEPHRNNTNPRDMQINRALFGCMTGLDCNCLSFCLKVELITSSG